MQANSLYEIAGKTAILDFSNPKPAFFQSVFHALDDRPTPIHYDFDEDGSGK